MGGWLLCLVHIRFTPVSLIPLLLCVCLSVCLLPPLCCLLPPRARVLQVLMRSMWLGLRPCSLFWGVGGPKPPARLTLLAFPSVCAAVLNTSLFSGAVKTKTEELELCNGVEGAGVPRMFWGS